MCLPQAEFAIMTGMYEHKLCDIHTSSASHIHRQPILVVHVEARNGLTTSLSVKDNVKGADEPQGPMHMYIQFVRPKGQMAYVNVGP